MSDLLTQLQDAVDMMATQFFSALRYVGTHHDSIPVNGGPEPPSEEKKPDSLVDEPEVFEAAMSELARDLILKTKQIEVLITTLPGIGVSEDEQQEKLRSLEQQLKEAEEERVRAVEEKERARERLESVVVSLRRV